MALYRSQTPFSLSRSDICLPTYAYLSWDTPRTLCPLGCNQMIDLNSVKHHYQTNVGEHLVALQDQLDTIMAHGLVGRFAKDIEWIGRKINNYGDISKVEQDKIRKSSSKLANLDKKFNALENFSSRILSLETNTADGTFVWKITGFSRYRRDAVSGSRPHLLSLIFTTRRPGYHLRLKLFPNGEGTGKGTHLSLFLVIVKGEYNALLPWPFEQTVRLMIMDLGRERKHVIYPFRPLTEQIGSFKRPVDDMNVPCGCPTILSLVNLEDNIRGQFVVQDEMYIKVVVNVTGLKVRSE